LLLTMSCALLLDELAARLDVAWLLILGGHTPIRDFRSRNRRALLDYSTRDHTDRPLSVLGHYTRGSYTPFRDFTSQNPYGPGLLHLRPCRIDRSHFMADRARICSVSIWRTGQDTPKKCLARGTLGLDKLLPELTISCRRRSLLKLCPTLQA